MSDSGSTKPFYDIAIIGGGMVGASLALLLARALPGKRILVLDAKPDVSPVPSTRGGDILGNLDADSDDRHHPFDARSTALSPSAVAVFQELAVWSDLSKFATAINTIHVSDRSHLGMAKFHEGDNQGAPLGFVVENSGFTQVLHQAMAASKAITFVAPQSISRVSPLVHGAALFDEKDEVFCTCTLAVIADGAQSNLRSRLGISASTKQYAQSALVTNIQHSQAHGGRAFERFTPRGPLALLPLGGHAQANYSALIWTFPSREIDTALAWSDEVFCQNLHDQFGYRLGNVLRVSKRLTYPLSLVIAEEQVRSSLVLMGNAAHFLHPVAGQGFNLALRDNMRLVSVLAKADSEGKSAGALSTLQVYESQQLPDQQRTIMMSDSVNRVFSNDNVLLTLGRNLGILTLELNTFSRAKLIENLAGRGSAAATPFSSFSY